MTNILEAICNIIDYKDFAIRELYSGRNRMNGMGNALENYVKNAFAGTFNINEELQRMKIFNKKFSWLGHKIIHLTL